MEGQNNNGFIRPFGEAKSNFNRHEENRHRHEDDWRSARPTDNEDWVEDYKTISIELKLYNKFAKKWQPLHFLCNSCYYLSY